MGRRPGHAEPLRPARRTQTVTRKVDLLEKHFPSQHDKQWYDGDAFTAILRLRGIECASRFAEGFHVRKTAV